jgi:hypothetical protein
LALKPAVPNRKAVEPIKNFEKPCWSGIARNLLYKRNAQRWYVASG